MEKSLEQQIAQRQGLVGNHISKLGQDPIQKSIQSTKQTVDQSTNKHTRKKTYTDEQALSTRLDDNQIKKAFETLGITSQSEESYLEKGKRLPIGTITNGMKKVAEGKWQRVTTKNSGDKSSKDPKEKVEKKPKSIYASEQDEKDSKEWVETYASDMLGAEIKDSKFSFAAFEKEHGMSHSLAQTILYNLENNELGQDIVNGIYDEGFGESDMNDSYWDIVADDEEFADYMGEEQDDEDDDDDDDDED